MKPKEKAAVLREAAEHFDAGYMLSTGGAIWWALSGGAPRDRNNELEALFDALFAPEDNTSRIFWCDDWGISMRECGTLALLFAAAMAETGDL